MQIAIVGLGPGDPKHLTREAWEVLQTAQEVWLRTSRHPTVAGLPDHLTLHSFDDLYDSAEDFQTVYQAIVQKVLELGDSPQGVVYAVPGHPLVGEATVQQLLSAADNAGLEVRIVEGLSFVEPSLTALGIDGLEGLQICDGIDLAAGHHPPLNPDQPVLVGQVYGQTLAADLKLTLMNQYPDDHPVVLVHAAGTTDAQTIKLPLHELDRQEVAHLSSLYVPPVQGLGSFEGLQESVARLRSPEGCPWDQEQTYESLRGDLLEESYEAVAAIDREDIDGLCEELGDVLLQVVLLTQIGTEAGEFRMVDVISRVNAKLIHRHPHVWGNQPAGDVDEILARWERLKREEKEEGASLLEGVPLVLPALLQAHIIGERVARVGFDWRNVEGVLAKVQEEMEELQEARSDLEVEAELGDLLFAVANWARHLGVEPEGALRQANERFTNRFRALEMLASERGLDLEAMSIDELELLWQEVKVRAGTGSTGANSGSGAVGA
jgi:tetrapyrrole methylase family protein/MazG family protein